MQLKLICTKKLIMIQNNITKNYTWKGIKISCLGLTAEMFKKGGCRITCDSIETSFEDLRGRLFKGPPKARVQPPLFVISG